MSLGGTGYVSVKVDGARQLRRTLRKAGKDMSDLKAAGKQAAEIVARAARANAPATTSKYPSQGRPGALRDSIRPGNIATGAIVKAGFKAVPYALPIHWGWLSVSGSYSGGKYKPGQKRNIKPNPFLSRAAQETEPIWLPIYMKHLETVLKSIEGSEK